MAIFQIYLHRLLFLLLRPQQSIIRIFIFIRKVPDHYIAIKKATIEERILIVPRHALYFGLKFSFYLLQLKFLVFILFAIYFSLFLAKAFTKMLQ